MCAGNIAPIIYVKLSMRLYYTTVGFEGLLKISHLTLTYCVYEMIEN